MFIARAMERAHLGEERLPPYQQSLFHDLANPLDEEALAEMLAYWEYDLDRLTKRGRGWREDVPGKPQIDVIVEITSKGNLKAEWFPRGWHRYGAQSASIGFDFPHFQRFEGRGSGYGTRPSNELFFLHDVESVLARIARAEEPLSTQPLDHVLLSAAAQVVERLKERLSYHFAIRMLTDVFVEWEEDEDDADPRSWRFPPPRIAKWTIEDPEERRRAAELLELEECEQRHGFSEAALIEARTAEEERTRPTGPAPSPHTLPDRLTRELKKRGLPATRKKVERALELIERHRKTSNVVSMTARTPTS